MIVTFQQPASMTTTDRDAVARCVLVVVLAAGPALAQAPDDPFPDPIEATDGVIVVGYTEFATLPDAGEQRARPMRLVDDPAAERLFVNDMWGPVYTVSHDGTRVERYLDIDDPGWGVPVEASGRERGVQSIALHPEFGVAGADGYGKLYAWLDTSDKSPAPDFVSGDGQDSHDTVLVEFSARDARAATYDGGPPRVLLRVEQPFGNHNGGYIAFNPLAAPGDAEFGLLYVGVADGGSGGDPMNLAQDLGRVFGKILRIDPLGDDSGNGRYGIPADNPYATAGGDALGEIFASGLRNPQGLAWDPVQGHMFVTDIGQNIVEEMGLVTSGANLGWNRWEGSYRFISRRAVDLNDARSEPGLTYPVAEYGQLDPILQSRSAAGGVVVYRDAAIPQLQGRVLFADFPQGEIFHLDADALPEGGQDGLRRVLLRDGGETRRLLDIVAETTERQGRDPAVRVDLRFGTGPDGRLFLMNKHDGIIREVVP